MDSQIHIQLFGHLTLTRDGDQVTRFRTQKTACLLAYLACFLRRNHPREELIDLFWQDVDLEAGRSSLRTALASLRRLLETPCSAGNTVLIADRQIVRLQPELVSTDVDAFEAALKRARRVEDHAVRARELSGAVALYQGPLLSGFYEDWVLQERTRLEQLYIDVLGEMAATLENLQELDRAAEIGQRLVAAEPLSEEAHLTLIRLYAALDQPSAARRQFREWERIVREELGEPPSAEARALLNRWLDARKTAAPLDRMRQTPSRQVVADRSGTALPLLRALPPRTPRLPIRLTRFFGREVEVEQCVALHGCQSRNDHETGLRLVAALAPFWVVRGHAREGLRWLELFLEQRATVSASTLAKALSALAVMQELFGDWGRVIELYEQSLQLYRQLGDKAAMAGVFAKMHSPIYFHNRNFARAAAVLDQSLTLYRAVGKLEGIAAVLVRQGNTVRNEGNDTLAASLYAQSLALYRQMGNRQGISHVLAEIGYMLTALQEFERAIAALEEAIDLSREINNKIGIAHCLWLLGRVREMQREYVAAELLFHDAIKVAQETGNRLQVFNATTNLGILADLQQDYPAGLKRHAEALVIAREMGNRWLIAYALIGMARMELFMGHQEPARHLFLQSLCILRDGGPRNRIAGTLLFLARIAAETGRPEQAVRLCAAVKGIERTVDWKLTPEAGADYEAWLRDARSELGEAEFDRIHAEDLIPLCTTSLRSSSHSSPLRIASPLCVAKNRLPQQAARLKAVSLRRLTALSAKRGFNSDGSHFRERGILYRRALCTFSRL